MKESLYFSYEKLLTNRAWAWNKLTNVPFEELFSEAKLGFFENIEKWEPNKSKLSTWLYLTINSKLQNFCNRYHNISPSYEETNFTKLLENEMQEESIFTEFTEEKKDINNLLKNLPTEYKEICIKIISEGKEISKAELTELLRKEGWKWSDIWRFYKEMKKILKNI
jgi:RNA polymerase sigma factor (sigma-70 family)